MPVPPQHSDHPEWRDTQSGMAEFWNSTLCTIQNYYPGVQVCREIWKASQTLIENILGFPDSCEQVCRGLNRSSGLVEAYNITQHSKQNQSAFLTEQNTSLCNNRVNPVIYHCELSNQSIQKTAPQKKEERERVVFHQEEICGRELLQSSWHCHQHLTFTQPGSLGESQHSSNKLQIPLRWNQTNPRESRNC